MFSHRCSPEVQGLLCSGVVIPQRKATHGCPALVFKPASARSQLLQPFCAGFNHGLRVVNTTYRPMYGERKWNCRTANKPGSKFCTRSHTCTRPGARVAFRWDIHGGQSNFNPRFILGHVTQRSHCGITVGLSHHDALQHLHSLFIYLCGPGEFSNEQSLYLSFI